MKKLFLALIVIAALGAGVYFSLPYIQQGLQALNQGGGKPGLNTSSTPHSRPSPQTEIDTTQAIADDQVFNRDTVGWLRIPGTDINESVLQSYNNEYYLRINAYKEQDIYGCYFADCDSVIGDRETMSPTTIIYGHSDLRDNPDGPRFSQLFRFVDSEFAEQNPVLHFSSLEENMVWQIFAVSYVGTQFDYISPVSTGEEMKEIADALAGGSLYEYPVEITPQDKILMLSTCTVKFGSSEDYRLVVAARLMEKDAQAPASVQIKKK